MLVLAESSRELEVERSRNAVLAAALSSAKAEREHAQTEAAAARQHVRQLEQQLHMASSAGDCDILMSLLVHIILNKKLLAYLACCTAHQLACLYVSMTRVTKCPHYTRGMKTLPSHLKMVKGDMWGEVYNDVELWL